MLLVKSSKSKNLLLPLQEALLLVFGHPLTGGVWLFVQVNQFVVKNNDIIQTNSFYTLNAEST